MSHFYGSQTGLRKTVASKQAPKPKVHKTGADVVKSRNDWVPEKVYKKIGGRS